MKTSKENYSDEVVEVCRRSAQRAADYAHDLRLVLKARNRKDVDTVFRDSMTDMGEAVDLADFEQQEKAAGYRPSFDRLRLKLLSYPLHNISYHLSEDLRSQLDADVKLPKGMLYHYGKDSDEMCKMVSILLKDFELERAKTLLLKSSVWVKLAGGYGHMILAQKTPAAVFATAVHWRFSMFSEYLSGWVHSKESMREYLNENGF